MVDIYKMSNEDLRKAIKKEQKQLSLQKERIKLLETLKSIRKENKANKNPRIEAIKKRLAKVAKALGQEVSYYGNNVRDNIEKEYGNAKR